MDSLEILYLSGGLGTTQCPGLRDERGGWCEGSLGFSA